VELGTIGRMLILAGLGLCILGGILLVAGKVPFLGRLPGDVRIEREGFSCYFPVVTMLVLSLLLTLVLNLLLRFRGPR